MKHPALRNPADGCFEAAVRAIYRSRSGREMVLMNRKNNSGFRIGAVIPAAGMSSRMGAFKPLLPCGGSTVIEQTVSAVLPYADTVVVVLGNRADEVKAVLNKRFGARVQTVLNPDYRSTDMLRSVQIGLSAPGECDGFFLLPGDMPAVKGSTFAALIRMFDGKRKLIIPMFRGRRGHPPLIHAALIPVIRDYHGEGGLRGALEGVEPELIALDDEGMTADLDTPGDYALMIQNTNGHPFR